MEFGVSIFFTDYSITPAELAVALEERSLDSLWVAEHSHIPVPRKTPAPGGGELAKRYYDVMDPFVTLSAAAAVTKNLKLGTGICLVIQRDTIQTAKLVASIDQVSGGRFIFGIGGGWNQEEIESHGTVFGTRMQKMREQMEAMKEIWTKSKAEYNGEIVKVPQMMTWPKPVQKPWPPIILGGAFPWAARRAVRYGDGWYPNASSGNPEEYMPRFWQMARDAGRDPKALKVTIGGAPEDADKTQAVARPRGDRREHTGATRAAGSDPADPRSLGKATAAGELTAYRAPARVLRQPRAKARGSHAPMLLRIDRNSQHVGRARQRRGCTSASATGSAIATSAPKSSNCSTVAMIYRSLGTKPKCGKCVPLVREMMRQVVELPQLEAVAGGRQRQGRPNVAGGRFRSHDNSRDDCGRRRCAVIRPFCGI